MTHTIPTTMTAVYLTGYGGFDKLQVRHDVSVPKPLVGEVLVKVGAAGINNTDINTRIGWYSKSVSADTDAGVSDGFGVEDDAAASWAGKTFTFPRIQGADVAGLIVAVGDGVDHKRIGERVMLRSMRANTRNNADFTCTTLGSEVDGGFAQFTKCESVHAVAVNCDWSDIELASLPCAYSTAEGMLQRAGVGDQIGQETVLITGASGGVGSAAVQLAKRRGARVIALSGASKMNAVLAVGADQVLERDGDLVQQLGAESVDVVVDLVAGKQWPALLEVLKRGGRYVASGAIAGPLVELDVRTLYLKDLNFYGATYQSDNIMQDVASYVERGEIKPLVAASFPLLEIVKAQQTFMAKAHVGKLVLVP